MTEPDVAEAAVWLSGRVNHTPVIRCEALDELAGARIWLKAENLQRGGSYKYRGAMRAVGRAAETGAPGVVTQSSGNHGIAVAMAASELGLPAAVVLPFGAEPAKVERIKAWGAEAIQVDDSVEGCRATAEGVRDARGYAFIDVRGDHDVIAGQGTASRELIEEVGELDALIVPAASGCGVAGAALAARGTGITVYAAEPAACGAMQASLLAGERVSASPGATIADALVARRPGGVPFELIKDVVARAIPVGENDIVRAFSLLLFRAKLLVEPAGAVGLAAALGGTVHRDVGVVLTGGNVARGLVERLICHG
ncbi:threonine/serine dehydratase [Nonomuraea sp. NPDC050556]|uniref:threonine/serine dehydratase n=1 Tax=Nonomuraea sp. NPDC050556 TaxID=3364369 RepID=UPI0037A08139